MKQTKELLDKALKEIAYLRESEAKQRKQSEEMRLALEKAQKQIASLKANQTNGNEGNEIVKQTVQRQNSDPEMEVTEGETLKRKKSELLDSGSEDNVTISEEAHKAAKASGAIPKMKPKPTSEIPTKPNPDKKPNPTNTFKKPKTSSGQVDLTQNNKQKKKL